MKILSKIRELFFSRDLERKINKIPAALEPDDAALLAQMRDKLGSLIDTPLGRAAIADAERAAERRGKAAIGSIIGMVPATETDQSEGDSDGDEDNRDIRPRFNQLSEKERLADQGEDGAPVGEPLQ